MDSGKLEARETCDKCKEPFMISVEYYEQAMKDGEPILCPSCLSKYLDEQAEIIPKRCFEYKLISIQEAPFDDLGQDGWELISVYGDIVYFKREIFIEG